MASGKTFPLQSLGFGPGHFRRCQPDLSGPNSPPSGCEVSIMIHLLFDCDNIKRDTSQRGHSRQHERQKHSNQHIFQGDIMNSSGACLATNLKITRDLM